jgi:pyruvate formate lyase activating enzyme
MSARKGHMTKREFLKLGLAGVGGFILCDHCRPLFAMTPRNDLVPAEGDLWKWSREAAHYIATPRGLKCRVCPNECEIKPGDTGNCKTKAVKEGKLYTLVYGDPCSVNVDPIEKKPLLHFYPTSMALSVATAGCNLACLNCQNWEISQVGPKETRNYDLMPDKLVKMAVDGKYLSIAYTYSDPVAFYEYTLESSRLARAAGIKNVIVSNGYIYEKPLRDWCQVVDAANIDLKSFSEDTYAMLNAGKLDPVLQALKIYKETGVWLEITNLVIPTWTDDMDMIREMCRWLMKNGFQETPLHFSRFMPLYKLTHLPQTPVDTLEKVRKIAMDEGIHYVYIGNVPNHPAENTWCPQCKKLLIERKGYTLMQNNLVNGKCKFCNHVIPGRWS